MRVLVATGSSGGHIFPALSFINALKDKYKKIDVLLVIPKRSANCNLSLDNIKVKYISFLPIQLSLEFKNLIALSKFCMGTLRSLTVLLEFKPDIVVGFGALDTIALMLFAWMARIRTLIHEQNVIPGRANRFLAKFSDRIAISFEETEKYLKDYRKKIVLTGNPLRQELTLIEKNTAQEFLGLAKDKFTILVMGGSQGSRHINEVFLQSLPMLSDKSNIQVIHITGIKDYALTYNKYKDLNLNHKTFSFLSEMQYAYSASDLVIARAGATAVAEIIFYKLPAILIPYPHAYAHQLENAKILRDKGCATIIKDQELNSGVLKKAIELFLHNPGKSKGMRSAYSSLKLLNANDLLVNEIISLNYN
jgi:UDP-N-acetylglucosamine--N-acetylmuramyl-(pentapeptide) pyrophosphoryl-undecaprenol N-acetylglucosamine transferase